MTRRPNYFRLNYNHGRTHSGMIAYLVELWNAGNKQPLDAFIEAFGVQLPKCKSLAPQLEYRNIDLAIKNEQGEVVLLLEMKVDDFQTWKKLSKKDLDKWKSVGNTKDYFSQHPTKGNPYLIQTEMYTFREDIHTLRIKNRPACLFVTLGTGEFKEEFMSPKDVWKHIGLESFVAAINAIDLTEDQLFQQWKVALQKELGLRGSCWKISEEADTEIDSGDRTGLLPMMRLGSLRRMLIDEYKIRTLGFEPSIYKVGVGPDTILNFLIPHDRRTEGFRFCEINNNGMLNMKIYFHAKAKREEKEKQVEAFIDDLTELNDFLPLTGGKYGKSKTVGRFDISLVAKILLPGKGESQESVSKYIFEILSLVKPLILETNE